MDALSFALTDHQLQLVMTAASSLPIEKHCLFLGSAQGFPRSLRAS
jgi:hypothetical protein